MSATPAPKDALAGIRVVDFTWAAAGPFATLYLALLGAEVIKIESRRSLDIARRGFYTAVDDIDASPNFNDMTLNKLSIRVDLSHPKGQAALRRLIAQSDVVTQNFRPGVLDKYGLGYDAARQARPDIVMLSSSTAGQTGPYRALGGYATTFGALGGLSHLTGYEDGPATENWESIDMRLGTSNALAALIGLYRRQRTGQGQHIDMASQEVIIAGLGEIFMDYFMNATVAGRQGNRDEIMAPHNCYPCRGDDRWLSIAVDTDAEWQALCGIAGRPDWASDPRFADRYARWKHQDVLDQTLAAWTKDQDARDLTRRLQQAGIAAMPSMDAGELRSDPHVLERGVFFTVEHPKLGLTHHVRPPWRLSETPARATRFGPMFGEHRDYVFGEILGMPTSEIAALESDGVFS